MKAPVLAGTPLPLFNHVAIETSAMCNRTCVFCPNHHNQRPDELMPWDLIEKTTQELKAMKWRGRWSPYIYNEPTRDPRILDIIRYVRKELPNASIMLNTNCDYFKRKEDLLAFYEAGARQMVLNIYSAQDGCGNPDKEARGVRAAAKRGDQIEQWVADLGLETGRDMYGVAPRNARRARVERKYGIQPESNKIGIFELQNRSGNIPWFQQEVDPLAKMCVRPWRSLNVNWLGDAILCCNDYHGEARFGNVRDATLVELWNAPDFNRFRLALQNKDRHVMLCDKCDYSGGHYQHLITPVTFGSAQADAKELRAIKRGIAIKLEDRK